MKRWIAAVLTACMLAVPAGAADQPSDWALEAVQTCLLYTSMEAKFNQRLDYSTAG